jgi:hypothetical protein
MTLPLDQIEIISTIHNICFILLIGTWYCIWSLCCVQSSSLNKVYLNRFYECWVGIDFCLITTYSYSQLF